MNINIVSSFRKLVPVIILILIIIVVLYSIALHEVEVAKVIVEITRSEPFTVSLLNESEKDGLIGDISVGKIRMNKLAAPEGNDMRQPGISVALYDEKGYTLSDWVSVHIKDKGDYELDIGLNRHVNKGEIIRVAVYVNDEEGEVVIGKKKIVEWE